MRGLAQKLSVLSKRRYGPNPVDERHDVCPAMLNSNVHLLAARTFAPIEPCSVRSGGGGRWGAPEKQSKAEAAWRMLTLARQSRAEFLP